MVSASFRWRMRSFLVVKILHSWRHWKTSHSLSSDVTHACIGGSVGLRWSFFFLLSSLFSLSFPRNSYMTFKKQLCPLVCDFIDFDPPFDYCLFGFWFFLKFFFFNFLLEHFIQFDFLFNLVPLLLMALFLCFILFLIIVILYNIILSNFITFFFLDLFFILILLISIFLFFS